MIITCAMVTLAATLSFAQTSQTTKKTISTENANTTGVKATTNAPVKRNVTPSPERMAERRAKMYEKQYSLTKEQYNGVYQAELEFAKENLAMHANGGTTDQAKLNQMMTVKDQKFKQAMSPEQYAKYESSKPKPASNKPAAK